MTTTYLITDANGHELTTGVPQSEVAATAQRLADDRREAVTVTPYVHDADGERVDDDGSAYEVEPEMA